jgi:transcriptional regulator with XRE-family HTH domain
MLSKKNLGQLVKTARKLKSKEIHKLYTQQMLANDINKSQSCIGDIESGRTYPSYVMLTKIASACNVSISFFETCSIDSDINHFINLNLKDINSTDVDKIGQALKQDFKLNLDYIISNLASSHENETPEQIVNLLIKQPSLINFCGLDFTKLGDKNLSNFIGELLEDIKVISEKYK